MNFVIIYSDMVGSTQALEITAASWEEAKEGLLQRLRDNQVVAEGVDKDSLNMFPSMVIRADNVEVKRVVPYVNEEGEELCEYLERIKSTESDQRE